MALRGLLCPNIPVALARVRTHERHLGCGVNVAWQEIACRQKRLATVNIQPLLPRPIEVTTKASFDVEIKDRHEHLGQVLTA
jgi:hypothetical protein